MTDFILLFATIILIPFLVVKITNWMELLLHQWSAKREMEYDSLCIKLVIFTAYWSGKDSIEKETLHELKNLVSLRVYKSEEEKTKQLEKITEEINEYFKTAAERVIDKSDIIRLCNKIVECNFDKNLHLSKALSTAAFLTDKFNPVLPEIFDKLRIYPWRIKDLHKNHTKTHKKKDSRKSDKKENTSNNTTNKKEETKKREKKTGNNNNQQNYKDNSFETLTLELLVEAMKVDRSKMVCELDVIKAFILKHDKKNFQERVLEVKNYLSYEYIEVHVEEICTNIYKQFRQDNQKREDILKLLFELIYADETCTNTEYNFLKKVAERLKVSKSAFDFMRMKYENRKNKQQNKRQESKQQSNRQNGNSQEDENQSNSQPKYTSELEKAYAALGIDKDASNKEIRASWRNLIRVNHPDLMESKGTEAVMKATVRTQENNKAFEIVKASREMK